MSSHGSHAEPELPDVDERLVAPESGYEIDDGKLVRVPPADEPHADRNSKLAALLEAHVADDFNAAVDMLTRTSRIDDIAPDASVFPVARDPRTGGRQLEHLAFEIVSTQSLADSGRKAAKLVGRGVRRVFAIDVERLRAFEWSTDLGTWSLLGPDAVITDPTLAVPLPIEPLLRAAKTDDAVAAALLAKRNPILVAAIARGRAEGRAEGVAAGRAEGVAEGRAEGVAEGLARALVQVLVHRRLEPTPAELARIQEERDPARLARWLAGALGCESVANLVGID